MTGGEVPVGKRVRVRGDEWVLSLRTAHVDCESVRLTGCGPSNRGLSRTLLRPFDRLVPVASGGRVRIVSRRRWLRHVAAAVRTAHPFGGLPVAVPAGIRLLPFQLEPALAMLRHGRLRLLIADEVGLGKTIQAGLLLAQLSAEVEGFRAIVLTPAGVREQWQQELRVRFSLTATISDAAWLAERTRDLPPEVNPWSLPGICIASLDLVKRPEVLRALEEVTWDIAIVDEVHGAAPGTARLAAAHAIASSARRVVLLTATPPDGEPAHSAALAALGRPDPGEPLAEFRRTRADAGATSRRKSVLLPVRLSRPERRMHRLLERYTSLVWTEAGARQDARARLAAVILRKRALSSAASLALSVRRRLALLGSEPPDDGQQLLLPLYAEDAVDDALPEDVIGASGLSDVPLERACLEEIASGADAAARVEGKLALLCRLLRRTSEPMIVFTEYRDTLAQIAAAVAPLREPVLLHGGMTPGERAAAQRAFTSTGDLLLATDAASEGLNLHERCRLVVHFELPWTPARLEQRTGRVDRLGQARPVHEILLVARHTCERLVLEPLMKRARTAAARRGRGSHLSALTESAVASAVMQGVPPDDRSPAAAAVADADAMNLRPEAEEEAARLTACRTLLDRQVAGLANGAASQDVMVTASRPGSHGSALLIIEVALARADGRRIHIELVPVRMDLADRDLPRRPAELRAWAERFISAQVAGALASAEAHARARLVSLSAQYRDAAASATRRERAIAENTPSAARRLVQVGLFDGREAAALASRRRAASLALLEAGERLADLSPESPLTTTTRIVALRFCARDAQP